LLRVQVRDGYFRKVFARDRQNGLHPKIDEFSPLNIYLPDMSARWTEAFAVTTGILRKFRQTVEANKSQFVLVTLSNAMQAHPEMQQKLKMKYVDVFDFEQPDRIIGEFAREEHTNYLQLMPLFREYHLRTGKYLHGFGDSHGGHWNENGHRLAAQKIFEFLAYKHLVPIDTVQSSND
jgi:hypothetical protein